MCFRLCLVAVLHLCLARRLPPSHEKPAPLIFNSNLSVMDRLVNLLIGATFKLDKLATLSPETDADKIDAHRQLMIRSEHDPYVKAIKSWEINEVKFPFGDGTGEGTLFLHRPPGTGTSRLPLFYYMHGGGLTLMSAESAYGTDLASGLFQRGVPVIWASVEYRLAPEHPFPAAFDDCVQGLVHLLKTPGLADKYGFDSEAVHIAGTSSGAYLAALTAAAAARDPTIGGSVRSLFIDQPMILIEPDFNTDSFIENANTKIAPPNWLRWSWRHYLHNYPGGLEAARHDWKVCPHLHPPHLSVPHLVITALGDPLRDGGRAYAKAISESGAQVTHIEARGSHALGLQVFDKVSREAMYQVLASFINGSTQ